MYTHTHLSCYHHQNHMHTLCSVRPQQILYQSYYIFKVMVRSETFKLSAKIVVDNKSLGIINTDQNIL